MLKEDASSHTTKSTSNNLSCNSTTRLLCPFRSTKKICYNQKIIIDPVTTFSLANYSFLPLHMSAFWCVLVLQIIVCFHPILMLAGFFSLVRRRSDKYHWKLTHTTTRSQVKMSSLTILVFSVELGLKS
jgi:hypothetical protein